MFIHVAFILFIYFCCYCSVEEQSSSCKYDTSQLSCDWVCCLDLFFHTEWTTLQYDDTLPWFCYLNLFFSCIQRIMWPNLSVFTSFFPKWHRNNLEMHYSISMLMFSSWREKSILLSLSCFFARKLFSFE